MQKNLINRQDTAKGGPNTSLTRHNNNLCQSNLLFQRGWAVWFKSIAFLTVVIFFISAYVGTAATLYVDINSTNPTSPYTTWEIAAKTIQDAIDAAQSGDTVVVTNGTYNAGGKVVYGSMTNRVAIDKPIIVQSVNGPAVTFIVGSKAPGGINGDGAIRCVYVGANALLSGFTLTNGHTRASGDYYKERSGGGVWCETNGVVSNCVLTGNSANFLDGGAYQGTLYNCVLTGNSADSRGGGAGGGASECTLYNCVLTGNSATYEGGGAYYSTLYNCTLTGNSSDYSRGGGAYYSTLYNCTLTGNSATYGGGVSYGTFYNCIVYYNTAPINPNYDSSSFYYSCTTPLSGGEGNIGDEPLFVDLVNGNLRLQFNSPCINAGTNYYAYGNVDLDGHPRISGGTVDMGAYEFQMPATNLFVIWLQKYGLPTDGSADYIDSDGDGLNNWQEYQLDTNPINNNTPGHFNLIQRLSNNKIHLNFVGEPNKQYKIETSRNLSKWVEIISVSITNADGSTSIDETNSAPIRFYRGRLMSQ